MWIIIIFKSHTASWIEDDNPAIPQLKGARPFSLEEISKCTNDFSQSNEIGKGGYGKVQISSILVHAATYMLQYRFESFDVSFSASGI